MEQLNLHKQKLYSLIIAGIALISLMLPWINLGMGFIGGATVNGFRGWGILSLIGIIGVALACFMEDRSVEFGEMSKKIALASFGAIGVGALLFFFRINAKTMGFGESGIGIWICLIAGVIGLVFVLGKIKLPDPK